MNLHSLKYVNRRSQISNCPDMWKGRAWMNLRAGPVIGGLMLSLQAERRE